MKKQKFDEFIYALRSYLVPRGKILVRAKKCGEKIQISLREQDIFSEEAYLTIYDKNRGCCVIEKRIKWQEKGVFEIDLNENDLSRMKTVDYARLCLIMKKKDQFVYSYLNDLNLNEENFDISNAYVGTIKSWEENENIERLIIYRSKAGTFSAKIVRSQKEFEQYTAPSVNKIFIEEEKLYFKIRKPEDISYEILLISNNDNIILEKERAELDEFDRYIDIASCDIKCLSKMEDSWLYYRGESEKKLRGENEWYNIEFEKQKIWIKEGTEGINVRKYPFKISAVIPVGQIRRSLEDTIDSIINQNIGFQENIQVLVMDISEEKGREICLEYQTLYPKNIKIIKVEQDVNMIEKILLNAEGKYLTIVNQGDIYSKGALKGAFNLLEKNKMLLDVVGIRPVTEIKQYRKYSDMFKATNSIASLIVDYKKVPLFLTGMVIKYDSMKSVMKQCRHGQFDEIEFLVHLLSQKEAYGLVANTAKVMVEKQEELLLTPEKFFAGIERMNQICKSILKKNNQIPYFVQRILAARICLWLENLEDLMEAYEHPEYDFREQWRQASKLINNIEDMILMEQEAPRFKKMFLLNLKYQREWELKTFKDKLYFTYGNTVTYDAATFITRVEILKIEEGKLIFEGNCHVPAGVNKSEIYAVVNGNKHNMIHINRCSDRYFFDKIYLKEQGFKLEISLKEEIYSIQICNCMEGHECIRKNIEFMQMCPVGRELKNSYYYESGYMVTTDGNYIFCQKCDEIERIEKEKLMQQEIKNLKGRAATEIISLRNYYWENKEEKQRKIWLITDRPDRADDNGEAFFRYIKSRTDVNIDCYFVLRKDSEKYKELKEIGTIIEPYSRKHKELHLLADYICSSQMSESANNPFDKDYIFFRDMYRRNKFVFLQHGVTHNEPGKVMGKYHRDFYGFVAVAKKEMECMKRPKFQYTDKEVWLTGFPRFDRLYKDEKNIITIMPTWRKYLTTREFNSELGTKAWNVNVDFVESQYFKFYNSLINDERLLSAAEEYGYQICFMPHVTFLRQANLFHKDERVQIYEYEKSYREIYAESNLVVTDYSSAVFDFAYLYKPVLYCQFDREEFYTRHTVKKGYWDFDRDGFGEVAKNLDDLVELMIDYMRNGCQLKDVYRKRIQDFFVYTDKNCSKRVFEHILDLENKR